MEVLVYAPSELAAMRERPFIRRILAESVLVYRRQADDALRRPETTGDIAE